MAPDRWFRLILVIFENSNIFRDRFPQQPGTGIKIISEKMARRLNPDFFFVTPWGFAKEFIKRERKWLKKGGTFIIPFPKLKLIKFYE